MAALSTVKWPFVPFEELTQSSDNVSQKAFVSRAISLLVLFIKYYYVNNTSKISGAASVDTLTYNLGLDSVKRMSLGIPKRRREDNIKEDLI